MSSAKNPLSLGKFFATLFTNQPDEEARLKNNFEAKAMGLVEPIIKAQGHAKALHDEFAPEVEKINALLKKSGIEKTIEWEITGEDNTDITLSVAGETYMVLKALETGNFQSSKSEEQCHGSENTSASMGNTRVYFKIGSNKSKIIEMANAVIQNQILDEDDMKKVGFILHAQKQEAAQRPRSHHNSTVRGM